MFMYWTKMMIQIRYDFITYKYKNILYILTYIVYTSLIQVLVKIKKTKQSRYFSCYSIGRIEGTYKIETYLSIIVLTLSKFEMMDRDKSLISTNIGAFSAWRLISVRSWNFKDVGP